MPLELAIDANFLPFFVSFPPSSGSGPGSAIQKISMDLTLDFWITNKLTILGIAVISRIVERAQRPLW
ncbi:uncharacterized protein LAJ45_07337 [Morchella importuna]|uniref:uncharacterized protein n=1 Tax=Morchella importuna TaxID=1174673 RepID=UPI001E8D5454|nr:uncharacterized protein LAJ45_07337 [Morchella importuna]KAH8148626.1 hypothetical protein LAJ45_07337 [Morchella importuna]